MAEACSPRGRTSSRWLPLSLLKPKISALSPSSETSCSTSQPLSSYGVCSVRSDAFAKATRSHRIIDRLEAIFGDEVYVYHNKIALKYPGVVGFSHHQDYAYWYKMGNLHPDMATCFIAVDRATRRNGCLKLVEGSHVLGRIDHVERDGVSDSGVDPERLEQVLERMPEVPIELESGDAVIFHCNVLHASDDNRSDESRIGLLGCYNTKHNSPYKSAHGHPSYVRQDKLADEITRADLDNLPDFTYQAS